MANPTDKTMVLKQTKTKPWLWSCRYRYHPRLKEDMKAIPGVEWNAASKCWMVPDELLDHVSTIASGYGYKAQRIPLRNMPYEPIEATTKGLYAYQVDAVTKVLNKPAPLRHIFTDEMGLGKTAQAIRTLQAEGCQKILIVCPAIVRSNWKAQLDKWWPTHGEVGLITCGPSVANLSKPVADRMQAAYCADIQIVSYNLVAHVERKGWDAIVMDEVHRCMNPQTAWSQDLRHIVGQNPTAAVFGLTATLMPNQPINAWHPLDLVYPGRVGNLQKNGDGCWKWKQRYSNPRHNGYGWSFDGVNTQFAEELQMRIAAMTTRTTKQDVAHLLPPFNVTYLSVPPASPRDYAKLMESTNFRSHEEKVSAVLMQAGTEKIPHVISWLEDATEEADRVCILTHLRETAKNIAEKAAKKYPTHAIFVLTGDITPEKRNAELAKARAASHSIVVATMHSVGIGIDLTAFPVALFAELYYRPETVIQALGRFSRLSGKVPSSVTMLCVEGTVDELVADSLRAKIEHINSVIEPGDSEEKLQTQLDMEEDDETFLTGIVSAASGMVVDDYE